MKIRLFLFAFALIASTTYAQPVLPPPPPGRLLNLWRFDDTNYLGALGSAPRIASNVELVDGVDANAAHFAGLFPALLPYNVIETSGRTNLDLHNGTMRFWFRSDWDSGTGPGTYARLVDAGVLTTDANYGWWSLFLDPFGSNLLFSAQANGQSTNYLAASVQWYAGEWHSVALTYSPSNSTLYVDGSDVADGVGVNLFPSVAVQLATGFAVGSDSTGGNLAQGSFDELKSYNYPLSAGQIADFYNAESGLVSLGGGFGMNSVSPPGFDDGGGSTNDFISVTNPPGYDGLSGSTNLWIEILPPTNNVSVLLLHNTHEGTNYQLLARPALGTNNWSIIQDLTGADSTT